MIFVAKMFSASHLTCVQHPHEVGFGLFSGLRQPPDSANIRSSGARITLSQTRVPDSGKGGSTATRTRSLTRPVALRTDSPRQPTPADTGRRTSQSGSFLTISVGYAKPKIPQFGLKKVLNVSCIIRGNCFSKLALMFLFWGMITFSGQTFNLHLLRSETFG